MKNTNNNFIEWLKGQHQEIMASEKLALDCLDAGDKAGYSDFMHEKARKLRDLHVQAKKHLAELPENERYKIEDRLSAFSSGAATSLALDSLFYMSALLYRDDHKEGEPDNLEILIAELNNGKQAK